MKRGWINRLVQKFIDNLIYEFMNNENFYKGIEKQPWYTIKDYKYRKIKKKEVKMSDCYFDHGRFGGCQGDFKCNHKDDVNGKCKAKDEELVDGDWGAMFPKEDTK